MHSFHIFKLRVYQRGTKSLSKTTFSSTFWIISDASVAACIDFDGDWNAIVQHIVRMIRNWFKNHVQSRIDVRGGVGAKGKCICDTAESQEIWCIGCVRRLLYKSKV